MGDSKNCSPIVITLIGPQGSGKGTQAARILDEFGLQYLSTGALFRETAKEDSPLGKEIKALIESGHYVPDELTMSMFKQKLFGQDLSGGILFDGIPRTLSQAKSLDNLLQELHIPLPVVLYLHIDRKTAIQRLLSRKICTQCQTPYLPADKSYQTGVCERCGGQVKSRADDTKEAIERRLEQYYNEVESLLNYYKKDSRYLEINGEQDIPAVSNDIINAISQKFCKE